MFRIFGRAIALAAVVLLFCSQREEDTGVRNNPCDPGGTSWTINAEPEISGTIDSDWADFNYLDSTGSVRLHISAIDRNLPIDTLNVTLVVGSGGQTRRSKVTDSVVAIDGLKFGAAYSCSLLVTDLKSGKDAEVISAFAPRVIPVEKPKPQISSGNYYITITWSRVNGAEKYYAYRATDLRGPYAVIRTVMQVASVYTPTVIDTPPDYTPRYYLVSAVNASGESFAADTLIGRRYYEGISTPGYPSASQGTYPDYIQVSVYAGYSSSETYRYELYRSIGDTLSFRYIGPVTTRSYSSSSYLTYNDSVKTSANCYYRVVAVDSYGRGSRPSGIGTGYLSRLYAPSVYASSTADRITLSWSGVSGARRYLIYRSSRVCADTMPVYDSTSSVFYNDSVTTSEYYYYRITAVDAYGREGTRSDCESARLVLLAAPYSVTASTGTYLSYIRLSWNSVSGADGYIIYRTRYGDFTMPIDTVTAATVYLDSVPEAVYYQYYVAAFNKRGVGALSSQVTGYLLLPPTPSGTVSGDLIRLSWSSTAAQEYYVYRSVADSTHFNLLDSTTSLQYSDSVKDYNRYNYRLAVRTADGVSKPGAIVSFIRPLPVPSGFTVTDLENGVLLRWNRVPQATGYQIYRSEYSSGGQVYRQVSDTAFVDTLSTTTRYWYCVATMSGTHLSSPTGSSLGGQLGPPPSPLSISVTGTSSGISITWQMPVSGSAASGFRVTRARTLTGPFTEIATTVVPNYFDSVADTGFYWYRIMAFNSKGNGPVSDMYVGQRLGPPAPSITVATLGIYRRKIVVTWSRVPSVTGYRCYRSTSTSGIFQLFATTADTLIADSTGSPNTYYYYKVSSYIGTIGGAMGSYTYGMLCSPPATVSVSSLSGAVNVTWPGQPYPLIHYRIYRSNSATGTFARIDSVTTNSYTDANPLSGDNLYKVSSVNADESALSVSSSAVRPQGPTAPPSIVASKGTESGRIVVSWTAPSGGGVIGYRLYRSPTAAFTSGTLLRATVTGTTYADAVQADSMYFYRVKSYNNSMESSLSDSTASGFRLPAAVPVTPSGIGCASRTGSVYISWQPPAPTVGYLGYRLYRSLSPDGSDSTVVVATVPNFSDVPPQSFPTVYWYRVAAYNQKGESVRSEAVSGYRE